MNIIVVDDELFLAEALCDFLSQEGYKCSAAESGKGALEQLPERQPEVVICDYNMPGMNGIELLGEIRRTHPETRVIIVTGFADVENAIQAVNRGASAFFRKPLDREGLIQALKEISQEIAEEKKEQFYCESLKKECARLRASLATLEHILGQHRELKSPEKR